MTQFGCVCASNLNGQNYVINFRSSKSGKRFDFHSSKSDFVGCSLRIPNRSATGTRARKGSSPLQVYFFINSLVLYHGCYWIN